ncbi:MAG: hypothetical protein GY857_17975, partial [Desulfobacula sp.]|nr:hypothetical protein [Desulfobacula sp.]
MFSRRKKYEVTDPGYYSQLISDQKKRVHKDKTNSEAWLELGRLFEARAAMTKEFANKRFWIRYFFLITLLFGAGSFSFLYFAIDHLFTWEFKIAAPLLYTICLLFIWNLIYPGSGDKYFKKAIEIDPNCGDAYQYLGQIALRKNQKTKAWHFLEKAIQLNAKNSGRIKRELKLLYEQEFVKFFGKQSEKEVKQQEIIDNQLDKIRILQSQNENLQKKLVTANGKVGQIKWETGHQTKLLGKKLEDDISLVHQKYEEQISQLKQEAEDESKEMAERKFIKLTTEIMEAKSSIQKQSFVGSAQVVKDIMGSNSWQILPEQVQIYLTTAEQIYTVLKNQKDDPDYSLVGMELCKALETMLNQTLVDPFVKYIQNNQTEFLRVSQTAEKNKKPVYFTYLSRVVDQVNYPYVTSLTLGQYHFVLTRTLEGDYALREYTAFLDKICADSGNIIGNKFLNQL